MSLKWGPWRGYTNPDGSRVRERELLRDGKPIRLDHRKFPPKKATRSVFKKNGGLRQAMVVHYVPRGGSLTMCTRWAGDVFSNTNLKHVGCKVCLRAMTTTPPQTRKRR